MCSLQASPSRLSGSHDFPPLSSSARALVGRPWRRPEDRPPVPAGSAARLTGLQAVLALAVWARQGVPNELIEAALWRYTAIGSCARSTRDALLEVRGPWCDRTNGNYLSPTSDVSRGCAERQSHQGRARAERN